MTHKTTVRDIIGNCPENGDQCCMSEGFLCDMGRDRIAAGEAVVQHFTDIFMPLAVEWERIASLVLEVDDNNGDLAIGLNVCAAILKKTIEEIT